MYKKISKPLSLFAAASLFFSGSFFIGQAAHAQYAPSQPGSLGVGKVTDSSVEWTFNLNGALVNEVQLFVGNETSPRLTQKVSNYASSIIESGLAPNARYEARRVRAVYFGTVGSFSDVFPATLTLQKIPVLSFEPIPPKNMLVSVAGDFGIGNGLTAWQVYNMTQGNLYGLVSTQNLQLGPFEPGQTYVFKARARNAEGVLTDWGSEINYTMPSSPSSAIPVSPTSDAKTGKVITLKSGVPALNVRNASSLSGKRIGLVRPGQAFEVLETQNGWYRIQFSTTVQGWISGKYVQGK